MLNKNFYLVFWEALMIVLLSATLSFAQRGGSNIAYGNELMSSGTIDFNTTINPRPDLAGKENAEKAEHVFIKIDQVINNSSDEDATDADKENIENKKESFDQVINPRAEK